LGIGIAFRKKSLQEVGGFNPDLQVFEYLELGLRTEGRRSKEVKTPELTVLHLEPESRFTLLGYLSRRREYGFWYHALFYLYPSRLSIYAFPVKLFLLLAMLSLAAVFQDSLFLFVLLAIYVVWMVLHFRLLNGENIVSFAISNYKHWYKKALVFVLALVILSLGEIAADLGKLQGMINSPTRK
jgi:hypothetical protein